jgi:hydrogenase maturation protease
MRALVVGYGNPLRGDDGVGPEVARRLAAELSDPEIVILAVHQLTPELTEPLSQARLALFIDASSEGTPGQVRVEEIQARPPEQSFTHEFDPPMLLAAAQLLYGRCPEARLVSLAGQSFEFEETLSAPVMQALPEAVGQVRRLLAR